MGTVNVMVECRTLFSVVLMTEIALQSTNFLIAKRTLTATSILLAMIQTKLVMAFAMDFSLIHQNGVMMEEVALSLMENIQIVKLTFHPIKVGVWKVLETEATIVENTTLKHVGGMMEIVLHSIKSILIMMCAFHMKLEMENATLNTLTTQKNVNGTEVIVKL